MKRFFAVLFALFVFLSLSATSVLAADKTATTQTLSQPSPMPIDYDLPYPGMLPDSPFYFIKVARDQVVGFLITSQVNKSFYHLLLSDKRLEAGQILISTGKNSIGVTTIASSEEYFSKAVDEAATAKGNNLEATELLAKLSVAAVKHQEVISDLTAKVIGEEKGTLNKAYSDNQNSQNRVQELTKK